MRKDGGCFGWVSDVGKLSGGNGRCNKSHRRRNATHNYMLLWERRLIQFATVVALLLVLT